MNDNREREELLRQHEELFKELTAPVRALCEKEAAQYLSTVHKVINDWYKVVHEELVDVYVSALHEEMGNVYIRALCEKLGVSDDR